MKKNQMVMKRIAIIILLLLGGLSYTGCYGRGLKGIFKRSVTIECYRLDGICYPWDSCVIDMVSGYDEIKDTLKNKGMAHLASKIDSTMEFYYRIENGKVRCYKIDKIYIMGVGYCSRGPAAPFFEYERCVTPLKCDSFLGEFKIKI